ncbi:MAG TPA: nickel pincer cofactor biosynthesis protein LarB [Thermodesulforhabdus norvegica]|uniref:Nickel pincer cofactor biosynthesis protein LarB n=1 Tax=Thermodesulforhabdus norvegica TaxID=39841 RepID=A0A7C1AWG7_9BACT|nr:nickel pincer cofactor biosynthesis protein LarB [Deltaproteobacteria bacterium]MBW2067667.1 nickel pincer cofactor biosynthesis protein LarB [Deltaproteobacteria bacterium]HDL90438.1 nickel pincer cofactor biosynthesis protein LarB [Thermodesulforhabdus norvegica]
MKQLIKVLEDFKKGFVDVHEVCEFIARLPYENLSFARLDHHRTLRRGFPEVVYGNGKTVEQLKEIVTSMQEMGSTVLITRIDKDVAAELSASFPEGNYSKTARVWFMRGSDIPAVDEGYVAILTGGTVDIPVAEEAAITAELMGSRVKRFYDVGVAGLHRLMDIWAELRKATVWVVVAGMEGALPSVVASLVEGPIIAIPTSAGYGSSFGGIAALLTMLNSCSPGIVVVNIDNGFGGGYVASIIHRRIALKGGDSQWQEEISDQTVEKPR